MNWTRRCAVTAITLLSATTARASSMDDPVCADRPGQGSATCTVPKRHWQVEWGLAGWSLSKSSGTRSTELDLAGTTIKYGVAERWDLEVAIGPYIRSVERSQAGRSSARGLGDMTIMVKHELAVPGAFSAALYPVLKLPTAARSIGNGKVEGGLVVPLQYALKSSALSLAASPDIDVAADGDGHGYHAAMTQVAGLGYQASRTLSLTVEVWGQWDWDPAGTVRQYRADVAAAVLAGSNVQLDSAVAVGLSRDAPDVELSGGVSVRF